MGGEKAGGSSARVFFGGGKRASLDTANAGGQGSSKGWKRQAATGELRLGRDGRLKSNIHRRDK